MKDERRRLRVENFKNFGADKVQVTIGDDRPQFVLTKEEARELGAMLIEMGKEE